MGIDEALKVFLLSKPGITDKIQDKLFPDESPQDAKYPLVIWIKVSDNKEHTLSGISKLCRPMYQFTAFSYSKVEAKEVAKEIKKALNDFVGVMSGIQVQWIKLENELSDKLTTPDGTIKLFTEALEFQINYEEE